MTREPISAHFDSLPSSVLPAKKAGARRPIWPFAVLAGFGGCFAPDSSTSAFCDPETPCADAQSCDLQTHTCILAQDAESLSGPGGSGAKQGSARIPPPPGGLVDTTPNSGWTEGTFSVSHNGDAEYDLPLWVPDGRRGLQPSLGLHYSNRSGNGLIGVGWSLQGLSSIAPCPRTIAQDGRTEGPSFSADDVYCMGGQRLRPTRENGWPAELDREYRTERDIFARIISHTPPRTVPGEIQGQPEYFKVWTKDGRILTFGGNAKSLTARAVIGINPEQPSFSQSLARTTLAWALSRIDDRNGNAIIVEYNREEINLNWRAAQMTPRRITYGPNRSVQFVYESRPDPIDRFQAGLDGGMPTRLASRLKTIQMYAGTELIREYRLAYDNNSITARSVLKSVTACDLEGVCLLPLEFDWSLGSYEFEDITTDATDVGAYASSGYRFVAGDIDGDGADDLVYGDRVNEWKMRFSNRVNGFGAARSAGIPQARGADYAPRIRPIDYNRDGRLDLLVEVPYPPGHPGWTKFDLYRWDGSAYQRYTPDIDSRRIGDFGQDNSGAVYSGYFADIDGNGLPDYLAPAIAANGLSLKWSFRLNLGTEFGPMQERNVITNVVTGEKIRVTDFDADGRADLLVQMLGPNLSTLHSALQYDDELAVFSIYTNLPYERLPENEDRRSLHFADINGDGLQDAIYPYSGLSTQLNGGKGFSHLLAGPTEYRDPIPSSDPSLDRGVRIVDMDGDGSDDVLIFHPGTPADLGDFEHGFQLYVWRNNRFIRIPLNQAVATIAGGTQAVQPPSISTATGSWTSRSCISRRPLIFDC